MVVVRVRLEMMMVVMGKMREDEFEADFHDDDGDSYANVGLDIDMPNKIDGGGN